MNLPVLIPVNASEFLEERGYDDECDTHVDVERLHDIGNSTGCEFEFECDPSLHALVVILGEGTGKIIGHQLFSNLCFQQVPYSTNYITKCACYLLCTRMDGECERWNSVHKADMLREICIIRRGERKVDFQKQLRIMKFGNFQLSLCCGSERESYEKSGNFKLPVKIIES